MSTDHYFTKAEARAAYEAKQALWVQATEYLSRTSAVASDIRGEALALGELMKGDPGPSTQVEAQELLALLEEAYALRQQKEIESKSQRGEIILSKLREAGVTVDLASVELAKVPDFSDQRSYGHGDDWVERVVVHAPEGTREFFFNHNSDVLHETLLLKRLD